jgi:hypothetical protein
MLENVERTCDEHADRCDCPDALIGYLHGRREYGLIVHDGGRSMRQIDFCPWCGGHRARGRALLLPRSIGRTRRA